MEILYSFLLSYLIKENMAHKFFGILDSLLFSIKEGINKGRLKMIFTS